MSEGQRSNVKLTLEYDGTLFHGWQEQPDCRTVEGVIREALDGLSAEAIQLHGASRTDQGVHAQGQVASCFLTSPVPTERLALVLNGRLPGDVRVSLAEEESASFHARFSAVGKRYRYLIDRRPVPGVFIARYALHRPTELDLDALRIAARAFLGEHDFTSYQSSSGTPREDTRCTVFAVNAAEEGGVLALDVWGNRFLYKMVRTMVGTLIEVGRGRWSPGRVSESLACLDRRSAGPTLPAHGLCLLTVFYDRVSLETALGNSLSNASPRPTLCELPGA